MKNTRFYFRIIIKQRKFFSLEISQTVKLRSRGKTKQAKQAMTVVIVLNTIKETVRLRSNIVTT